MLAWFKKKIKQLTCKHLYISKDPILNPETWEYEHECGKCEYVKKSRG